MTTLNEIYIRRADKFLATFQLDLQRSINIAEVATFAKNLESLGYTLGPSAIETLLGADKSSIARIAEEVTSVIRQLLGADVRYAPMYPNFPQQVMDASAAELYINAVMHYFGDAIGARIMPVYEKKERPALTHKKPLKVLEMGTESDFTDLMHSVILSKVSFSETDRNDVKAFLTNEELFNEHLLPFITDNITNKENLAHVSGYLVGIGQFIPSVRAQFKTATDVLRLAAAISDGDVSLATKTQFRKMKKVERRNILELLENAGALEEDMLRYASAWKRLGEILHPGEYASRYPKTAAAFKAIRNNDKIETFNSRVEALIKGNELEKAAVELSKRPGEFARRLDVLVSRAATPYVILQILGEFQKVAHNVSPSVLVQLEQNLRNRTETSNLRSFFPKGNLSKIQVTSEKRRPISPDISGLARAVTEEGLVKQFKDRESLGKVFVDPALKGYVIPFGVRSASANRHTLGRGTRIALPEGTSTVRFFTYWKDIEGDPSDYYGRHRVDIDLSMGLMNGEFKDTGTVSYYNLREVGGYHSGDITSAPNGASEFVDLDIDKALKAGHRYAYMTLHNYTGQMFSELDVCFAGFMARNDANSGEIYEPTTVENKIDITSESRQGIPIIVDLENREVIWVDMNIPNRIGLVNVHTNRSNLSLVSEAMVTRKAPNLYTLFTTHATARGELVDTREDADIVFALDGDVTPYDSEKILSEYL